MILQGENAEELLRKELGDGEGSLKEQFRCIAQGHQQPPPLTLCGTVQ